MIYGLLEAENLTFFGYLFSLLNKFSFSKLKKNPIKCTCKLKNDLSSIKDKIIDLNFIHCTNINKTVEEAIKDVNCGMSCVIILLLPTLFWLIGVSSYIIDYLSSHAKKLETTFRKEITQ